LINNGCALCNCYLLHYLARPDHAGRNPIPTT